MAPLFGDTTATLVVDDDDVTSLTIVRLLEREGYHCTTAVDATEARARLAETAFALAIVDVMMPGESGLELAERMLTDHPDIAVVMVTGVDDPSIAKQALETGVYGYVVKPFRANELLITVANAGRRRCLEIARRAYQNRLERLVDEHAIDLDVARFLNEVGAGQSRGRG